MTESFSLQSHNHANQWWENRLNDGHNIIWMTNKMRIIKMRLGPLRYSGNRRSNIFLFFDHSFCRDSLRDSPAGSPTSCTLSKSTIFGRLFHNIVIVLGSVIGSVNSVRMDACSKRRPSKKIMCWMPSKLFAFQQVLPRFKNFFDDLQEKLFPKDRTCLACSAC